MHNLTDDWKPSRARVLFACPLCLQWQIDMPWYWRVEYERELNDILKEHLLACDPINVMR